MIQQFMDTDPSEKVSDFACGQASYDGHKGTDFRVSPKELAAGTPVLAAAEGIVVGTRDSMPDHRIKTRADNDAVKGKECGNGVVLRHQDGLETQYCHMRLGSIVVNRGQRVKRGAILGLVGLSGKTEFPHLHLSVRRNGEPVDPFAPQKMMGQCSFDAKDSLWDAGFAQSFSYQPSSVVQIGFANGAVEMNGIVDGVLAPFVARSSQPLVVYGLAVNGLAGDRLRLELVGPGGEIVGNLRPELAKRKAQWMAFAGKKAPAGGWPAGAYKGRVSIIRAGQLVDSLEMSFQLR